MYSLKHRVFWQHLLSPAFVHVSGCIVFHTLHSDLLTLLQIWDLESKSVVDELRLPQDQPLGRKAMQHYCVSVSWSADGATLYGGYTDGTIRVWGIGRAL